MKVKDWMVLGALCVLLSFITFRFLFGLESLFVMPMLWAYIIICVRIWFFSILLRRDKREGKLQMEI